jgi:hypothetical protein
VETATGSGHESTWLAVTSHFRSQCRTILKWTWLPFFLISCSRSPSERAPYLLFFLRLGLSCRDAPRSTIIGAQPTSCIVLPFRNIPQESSPMGYIIPSFDWIRRGVR